MSATFNRFDIVAFDVLNARHDFGAGSFAVFLTDNTPSLSDTVKGDITEIAAGNGYSAGGEGASLTVTQTGNGAQVDCPDVVFFASGGSVGPFRYAVIYNTSPPQQLLGWWDYGSSITLADQEQLTVRIDDEVLLKILEQGT